MPRKQNESHENYNKPFPKALRQLMEERGTTQQELADFLHKTRQVISCYCDGSSSPLWETIADICKFFSVSADWLLGLSDVRTNEGTIRAACMYTNLSEEAVTYLHFASEKSPNRYKEYIALFSKMLCNYKLWDSVSELQKAIDSEVKCSTDKTTLTDDVHILDMQDELELHGYVVLNRISAIDYFMNQATKNFANLADDIVYAESKIRKISLAELDDLEFETKVKEMSENARKEEC